jgi:hypothetical protein
VHALFERAVEVDLADLAAVRRLRELGDGEEIVGEGLCNCPVHAGYPLHLDHLPKESDG